MDLEDIQGNILAGFNTNVEVLIGLTADPARDRDTAAWLVSLAPSTTSVIDVREQRRAMKPLPDGNARPIYWQGVGIGAALLSRIRPDLYIRDEAFNRGFRKRAPTALGDRTDPNEWRVGGVDPLDVLLVIGSNHELAAEQRGDELVAQAQGAGLARTYRETARRIQDLEHFGFRDGVSQPSVRGFDANGEVGPGYFVFGYEKEVGEADLPQHIDPRGFLRNGSLMVFRRLAQDVAKFRTFCTAKAADLAIAQWPGLRAPHLEALLVGRWPSGALATVDVATDPGRPANENGFDFSDDMLGTRCPFGAQIRKVNPRAGPKDEVRVPRIIRRGIPFGPPFKDDPTAPRGLAFISFQTSIVDQLEFLTSRWMNVPTRPGPGSGHDLLVGRSTAVRSMDLPGPSGRVTVSDDGQQWIIPTGGGYMFAPGKAALGRLLDPLADGVAWRAQKAIAQAVDLVFETVSLVKSN
jgi:Dyp-type peroxidase family